jgi:hypothetical protein
MSDRVLDNITKVLAGTFVLLLPAVLVIGILVATNSGSKEIDYIVVCPDGQNNCTRYEPHEIKVFYR